MRFSIVMPSFNQALYVEAALESVLSQDYANFELLFIDGGSSDGTMEIVEKYRHRLACCISERDSGQSEALQKGFMRSTGDILTWLSTDDLLLPGALSRAAQAFKANPNISWLLGNVIWISADDRILKCWRGEGYTPGWLQLGIFAAGGPSAFFRKALYERVGGINAALHYQMDTELWWRFAMAGERFLRLRGYTWALRIHDQAKVSGHIFAASDDQKQSKVRELKEAERTHIELLTRGLRKLQLPILSPTLSALRKISSPAYIRGLIETRLYSGQNIYCLAKKLLHD